MTLWTHFHLFIHSIDVEIWTVYSPEELQSEREVGCAEAQERRGWANVCSS